MTDEKTLDAMIIAVSLLTATQAKFEDAPPIEYATLNAAESKAILDRIHDLHTALYWVMNVVHNVSRVDGGPLRSGEAEEAFANAVRVLDGDA